jgi:endonuclease III related protein
MSQPSLLKIYRSLLSAFGPRHWWPAKTSEEVIFGAILTQNTTWKNAKRAIEELKNAGKLSFEAIKNMNEKKLGELARPARFFNQKAKTLKVFADYFGNRYNFDVKKMKNVDREKLREELLSLYRIGPETADSILLYALKKPIFVIDAYTKRIFSQHGFMKNDDSYDAYQKFFMDNLPHDVKLYNEFHALIVHTGYLYCKPKPLCEECPLSHF